MTNNLIYLDYNVFTYYHENRDDGIRKRIDEMKKTYRFCYSPAHMEDIGSSLLWSRGMSDIDAARTSALTMDKVLTISAITDNLEILAKTENGPRELTNEFPADCLMRVLEHADSNYMLDDLEKEMFERFRASDPDGAIAKIASNLPFHFLSSSKHREQLLNRLSSPPKIETEGLDVEENNYSWENISKTRTVMDRAFEITFNYLEEIRYRPDSAKKYRSHLHDVSHAIYASHTDYFITNDAKFAHKARAAYDFLGARTKVIDYSDFIGCSESLPRALKS